MFAAPCYLYDCMPNNWALRQAKRRDLPAVMFQFDDDRVKRVLVGVIDRRVVFSDALWILLAELRNSGRPPLIASCV